MQTPFTPHFKQASIPLTQVSYEPFEPTYPLPFVGPETTAYYVGDGCELSYRWHDAFDVFIAVLTANFADAQKAITIPVSSHLSDLHLVYQLVGTTHVQPKKGINNPTIQLKEDQHFAAYTPPADATLRIQPAEQTCQFALVAVVPKGGWMTRHHNPKPSPLEALVGCLRQKHADYQIIQPTLITPPIRVWLHLLLTTSAHPGLLMDGALHHATAQLVEQHHIECAQTAEADEEYIQATAARQLARSLVSRLDGDKLLTVNELAAVMHVAPKSLWKAHQRFYEGSLDQYLHEQLMARAKAMLDDGMTIKSVSVTLGYSTQNNFSRSFKKQYGVSPNNYPHSGKK